MHYVIGDIHGCFDDMMALINKIEEQDKDAQFYFVGDFIDRGPQVEKTIEWVMNNITIDGKYQTVLGNHEDMVIEWFKEVIYLDRQGRLKELPQTNFDFSTICEKNNWTTIEQIKPMIDFFKTYPLEKDIEIINGKGQIIKFKIVHAWYDFNVTRNDILRDVVLWERNFGGNEQNDTIIVHGHTPTIADEYIFWNRKDVHPGMITFQKNAINVDGGCVFSSHYYEYPCMLGAICLETMEEIYPYTLEERFHSIIKSLDNQEIEEHIQEYKDYYLNHKNRYKEEMQKRIRGE